MKLSITEALSRPGLFFGLLLFALQSACVYPVGIAAAANTLTTLHEFRRDVDGAAPVSNIVLAEGKLYGTTWEGDGGTAGAIWSLDVQDHTFAKLYNFSPSDGNGPIGGITFHGGKLYGTTYLGGGSGGNGTIWSFDTATNAFKKLHTLSSADGGFSNGGVVTDGNTLYGTTRLGGRLGNGTIWSLDLASSGFTKHHDFAIDGSVGGVKIVGDRLIGTTYDDRFGLSGGDSVWSLNLNNNSFMSLRNFDRYYDGSGTLGNIAIWGDSAYGTLADGGEHGAGSLWKINLTNGDFTVLHDFNFLDGRANRIAEHVYDGKILGVGWEGGNEGAGTLWMYDIPSASFELLRSFERARGEYHPSGGIVLSGNTIFGTTKEGGATYDGTIWSYPIPEPSSALMALAAILSTAGASRRRRIG